MLQCMNTRFCLGLLLSSFGSFSSAFSPVFAAPAAPASVPDFTVQVGLEQNAKMRGWLVNFLPPAHHHFNIDAPMKVTALSDQVAFLKVGAIKEQVGFRSSDQKLKPGTEATAAIFLCDDAKTFCIKKTLTFALTATPDFKKLDFTAPKSDATTAPGTGKASDPLKAVPVKKPGKKDAHGFWDNNLNAAIADASKTGKPILVDFYGIWCPPCNLFNESVFPTASFKAAAQKWVLLKMDADAPESFELKSHFKIGGYPTILAIKAPSGKTEITWLSEIDRIVGFYPAAEFVDLMNKAYANRANTSDTNLENRKIAYLQALKSEISTRYEKKEFKEAAALAEDGAKIGGKDHFYAMTSLAIKTNDRATALKDAGSVDLLKAIWENRVGEDSETLMRMEDVIANNPKELIKEQVMWANDLLDELAKRISKDTLSVPGVELSIADIDASRVDVAEALGDDVLLKKSYQRTVDSYQKLIQKFHAEDSRGYNLELGYYLWKSGAVDQAKALYTRFIKKYPAEFTFYYAAAKMYLELKDYSTARDYAEKAVKYAYGDNKLRSMERLVRVLTASGDTTLAVKTGKDLLDATNPPNADLFIRTGRYIAALKKAVDEAEKGKL